MTKLSIIVPVYNEAATVRELLDRVLGVDLPTGVSKQVVVVENGSSDGTVEIIKSIQRRVDFEASRHSEGTSPLEFKVLYLPKALGKGYAVRKGFEAASGDIFLIQDGDLEYDVADYPSLLQPILDGRADFVLGSRHLSAASWKIRTFEKSPLKAFVLNCGGVFFHSFFNLLYGVRLTDPTTMYKVFRASCLNGLTFKANRFDFDYELLGKLIRRGFKPLEIPVSYRSRGFEQGKKVGFLRDPLTWIWAILRFRFSAL